MKTKIVCLLTVCALGAGIGSAAIAQQIVAPPSVLPLKVKSTFASGYQTWTRVNPVPHRVISAIAGLCRTPTPQEQAERIGNPHNDKYMTVYVNPIGKAAMITQKTPVFPRGSIIVKEKKIFPNDPVPELLTVMRKREPGYDRANGDWEYLVLSGKGNEIRALGKLPNCQSCHAKWGAKSDYVSRAYLPEKLRRALK